MKVTRTQRVQGIRRSGAAGPHGGRNPQEPLTRTEAIIEQMDDKETTMSKFRLTFMATPKQGVVPIQIGADVSSSMRESVSVLQVDSSWIGGQASIRVLFEAPDQQTATDASNAALHGCFSHRGIDSIHVRPSSIR